MLFDYDKNKTYLVACSGGPDSMALLDMLYNNGFSLIIAHVNYKTRKESDDEEKLVINYCKERNLRYFINYFDHNYKGSFEACAREFRYSFFAKIYHEFACGGLFVAHHKDDLLETYLLKKQRNVVNESYLILKETTIKKMKVLRPLLYDFYKEDLLKYCQNNNIPYGIDYSNFLDIHPRNVIRKKIALMDKQKLYETAIQDEKTLKETRNDVLKFIKFYPIYTIDLLTPHNDLWLKIFLYELCDKKYRKYINKSIFLTFKSYLKSQKSNLFYLIHDNYYIEKSYQVIAFNYYFNQNFSYILEKLEYICTPYFKIVNSGLKMQGVYVDDNDFPINIRNYHEDDKINLKDGTKKVSRLFIDKKIPLMKRKEWIVIENCHHEIIFVYELYRKYGLKNIKNNLFILK